MARVPGHYPGTFPPLSLDQSPVPSAFSPGLQEGPEPFPRAREISGGDLDPPANPASLDPHLRMGEPPNPWLPNQAEKPVSSRPPPPTWPNYRDPPPCRPPGPPFDPIRSRWRPWPFHRGGPRPRRWAGSGLPWPGYPWMAPSAIFSGARGPPSPSGPPKTASPPGGPPRVGFPLGSTGWRWTGKPPLPGSRPPFPLDGEPPSRTGGVGQDPPLSPGPVNPLLHLQVGPKVPWSPPSAPSLIALTSRALLARSPRPTPAAWGISCPVYPAHPTVSSTLLTPSREIGPRAAPSPWSLAPRPVTICRAQWPRR